MIKFVFRWAFRFLVLAIVLVIGLILLKDTLVKEVAEKRIRSETGLEVRIGKMHAGLFSPTVSIQNLVLYNTAEFGGGPFLDIPDLHLEYGYKKVPFQGLHFKLLRLNLRELNIVESNDGETNLVALLERIAPEALGKKKPGAGESDFGGIDMLNLSVGKVHYTSLRNPRRNQEVNIAMRNAIIQDIRTEQDLAGVFLKVLIRAGITIYTDSSKTPEKASKQAAAH